jgi:hypothetical protein
VTGQACSRIERQPKFTKNDLRQVLVCSESGGGSTGAMMIALSMFDVLVFGLLYHFVLNTPDHIHRLPVCPWSLPFILSAIALTPIELAGAILGFRAWRVIRT